MVHELMSPQPVEFGDQFVLGATFPLGLVALWMRRLGLVTRETAR
jgi:hypothetical protein